MAVALVAVAALGGVARAEDGSATAPADPAPVVVADPPAPLCQSFWDVTSIHDAPALALFLAGGAVGFVAHESGHVVTNLALGNTPQFQHITTFGFIPFVAINPRLDCHGSACTKHDGTPLFGGEGGKYMIVTAGYDVQHITTEVLLTLEPDLRYRGGPFRKGLFAFDILLSAGYALSSVTGTESPFGDSANATAASGIPKVVFAGILIAPAALDTYRFFRPRSRWAPWASRAAKVGMVGITFAL